MPCGLSVGVEEFESVLHPVLFDFCVLVFSSIFCFNRCANSGGTYQRESIRLFVSQLDRCVMGYKGW